jgi:hypothetical protein
MSAPAVSHQVLQELETELPAEEVQLGLHRLNELVELNGEALMFSEAKAKWSAIGARADKGQGTLVQRRDGVTLLVVPLTKAVQMAANARSGRTMGDIRRAYPGVTESAAPRLTAPGGRVWSPELPDAAAPKTRSR